MRISASLVLFHNKPEVYCVAIKSFLDACDGTLYVVDNSLTPLRHEYFSHPRVMYIYPGKNLGFGSAHNLALKHLREPSEAHLILNPDISFSPEVIPHLINRMSAETDIGALMPKIVYLNGELQRLCKLLPTPLHLIFRRFVPFPRLRKYIDEVYELSGLRQDIPSDVPSLSGCFLLVRSSVLQKVKGFDERYFMYMEDVDLIRRINDIARTVYDPAVFVSHGYGKGSYRDKKLLYYHIRSAIKYFNKWGWFVDSVRASRNRQILGTIGDRQSS